MVRVDVLDSPYSWVVAVACSLMYFVMYGLARASGLLFVATLSCYDTNRETASFPFTLACALRYLGGPLAGYLAGKFGLRLVILLGCLLSFVGVGTCFVAENIILVAILWGGFYGIGSSFSSCQLPQMNNLYFHKHLTKSNGVSYAGAALAGIVLPPLIETLLNEYGIKGTYLLLSGLALNSIPVGMLMREPPEGTVSKEEKAKNEPNHIKSISVNSLFSIGARNSTRSLKFPILHNLISNSVLSSNGEQSKRIQRFDNPIKTDTFHSQKLEKEESAVISHEIVRRNCSQKLTSVDVVLSSKNKEDGRISNLNNDKLLKTNAFGRRAISEISILAENETMCIRNYDSYKDTSLISSLNNNEKCQNIRTLSQNSIDSMECLKAKILPDVKVGTKEIGFRAFDIFYDIKFLLICFTGSINGYFCFVLPTILNDFALDKGISLTYSTYMLMAMSVTDLLGRVGFGWVIDSGFMSLTNLCAVCFFVLAVSLAFVVWSSNLIALYIILSVMGLSLGVHAPLPACLITKYIRTERHIMANASLDVLSVPFLLLTSSMIGYFRDELGSYDWFVYILCIISAICCAMMLVLPFIERGETKTVFVIP